jgi:phosphoglycolate phosphatase-like HAD superfamily hydrolase
MEGIILFDIDGTLFNPQEFGRLIRAEFLKILKVPEEELIRANADYYARLKSSTDLNPHDLAAHIASEFGVPAQDLDSIFWQNERIYQEALYPETIEVLKKISQANVLGVFSEGNEELQVRKLNASNIAQFFNKNYLFIHNRKISPETMSALPEGVTIIDNKHDIAAELARICNVVWINRINEEKDPNIKTIHSLSELI